MNWKSILVLLLSGSWIWVGHYWYCCNVKGACYNCGQQTETVAVVPVNEPSPDEVLLSNWASAGFLPGESWTKVTDDILAANTGDNVLEISGAYHAGEPAPEGYENLGLARANTLKNMLADRLPEERIQLTSHLLVADDSLSKALFPPVSTQWKTFDPDGPLLVENDRKAIIYFPTNSFFKKPVEELKTYLRNVAKRVNASGEIIYLTGHTDNQGSYHTNEKLAFKRAMRIRRLLRIYGVPREQIAVASQGEQSPIATNATESGRQQNRRVVLVIKPVDH